MGSPVKEEEKRMLPPLPPPSLQRWGVLPPSPPRPSGDAARSHQRAAGAREIGGRRGACDIPEVSARSVAHSPRAFAVGWGGQDADHLTVEKGEARRIQFFKYLLVNLVILN